MVFISIYSFIAKAATTPALKEYTHPVFFPPEKNSVRILPQKFEYSLIDQDHIRVGDVIVDANSTTINLKSEDNNFKFAFSWPAGLLNKGTVLVKSQTGKTIFKENINSKNIKIVNPQNHQEGIRDELAVVEFNEIKPDLIEDLKYMPFFNFCIFREDSNANVNLCSRDLYLSYAEETLKIKPRDTERQDKPAYVEINNKRVTEHGLIFLYNKTENISFKAQASSGTYLEISTLKEDLEFIDIVQGKSFDKAIIQAQGPEPLGQHQIIENSSSATTGWRAVVDVERPFLYIRALGDIPLRQDMLIKEKLPQEKYRPLLKKTILRTYNAESVFYGQLKPNTSLNNIEDNSISETTASSDEFKWTVSQLEKRTLNKRYLTLTTSDGPFVIMQDIYRGASNDLSLEFSQGSSSSSKISGKLGKWWSPRMGSYFTLGSLSMKDSDTQTSSNISVFNLDFLYRFVHGLHNDTPSSGLTLSYLNYKFQDFNLPFLGFGLFSSRKSNIKWLGEWQWLDIHLYPFCSDSIYKKSSFLELKFTPKYFLSPTVYAQWGLGYNKFDILSDESKKSTSQLFLELSLGLLF
jgi:hypothetical protein